LVTPAEALSAWVVKASLVASGGLVALPVPYADAVAAEVTTAPVFAGPDGALRTAALDVALAWLEGANNPSILGDCLIPDERPGYHPCTEARQPRSFCAMQVFLPGGARTLEGWGRADLLTDPAKCVHAGNRIILASILADRTGTCALCIYARGRDTPEARRLSDHRMRLAKKLLAEVPAVSL
ncbi:MAG TPA: hypothetical protein VF287_06885, partial [Usitatibacter sp.]